MKPSAFSYEAPSTVDETTALLSERGDEAKVLAGGQSLVPMMNYRLARPGVVVDINGLTALRYVDSDASEVRVGALARHSDMIASRGQGAIFDAFRKLGPHIGHEAIRNRGTLCGSLAHADPAAEWCVMAQALDGIVVLESSKGAREVVASDFFEAVFMTATRPEELVTALRIPTLPESTGIGFHELARRTGDFAVVMAFAAVSVSDSRVADCRIALGGMGSVPIRATGAESMLVGAPMSDESAVRSACSAASAACDPSTDVHATAEYRRRMAEVLTRRALLDALSSAPNTN